MSKQKENKENGNGSKQPFDAKMLRGGGEIVLRSIDNESIKLSVEIMTQLASCGPGVSITVTEALMCIRTCSVYGLDPYLKQIFLIKYDAGRPASIVIAADTYIRIADSSPVYGGYETGWLITDAQGKMRKCVPHGTGHAANEKIIGAWCQAFRQGRKTPVVEVATREVDKGRSTWKTMPETMVTKCAIARAHRRAFPDMLGGLYSIDERPDLAAGMPEYEPEGNVEAQKRGERTETSEHVRTLDMAMAAMAREFDLALEFRWPDATDDQKDKLLYDVAAFLCGGKWEDYQEQTNWTITKADQLTQEFRQNGVPDAVAIGHIPKPAEFVDESPTPEAIGQMEAEAEAAAADGLFNKGGA